MMTTERVISEPTKAQLRVLVALYEYRRVNRINPTMDELAKVLKRSRAAVCEQLGKLEAKGLVDSMSPGCSRNYAPSFIGHCRAQDHAHT